MEERKFKVIQEFKYVPKGVSWSVDKRFKGQQQKDILKIAKIGDIWKYEEVVRNEWPIAELSGRRAYFSDDKNQAYYFQEITEAEEILEFIKYNVGYIEGRGRYGYSYERMEQTFISFMEEYQKEKNITDNRLVDYLKKLLGEE